MPSGRYWHFLACAFFLLQSFALHAARPDDAALSTYRGTAAEVRISFFATDELNHAVSPITMDDFAIVDDDLVIRAFRSLAQSDETMVRAVVLIDSSGSIANWLAEIKQQVVGMLSQDSFEGGELSVVSFSGLQPMLLCHADCQTPAAAQKLMSLTASGPTPLFDAIAYSTSLLSRRPSSARPVLILFSDGDDTISRLSASDAMQSLINSGTLLYAVDVNNPKTSDGSALLREMANVSGGRYFSSAKGTPSVLATASNDLRASWVVTYKLPVATSGFHSLRILPKHNLNLRFHCRSGYYSGMGTP